MLAAYFVWQQVGVYTLSGVGLYILLLPINMLLGKVCAQREREEGGREFVCDFTPAS